MRLRAPAGLWVSHTDAAVSTVGQRCRNTSPMRLRFFFSGSCLEFSIIFDERAKSRSSGGISAGGQLLWMQKPSPLGAESVAEAFSKGRTWLSPGKVH